MNAEGRNLLMGKFEPGPLELENSTVLHQTTSAISRASRLKRSIYSLSMMIDSFQE